MKKILTIVAFLCASMVGWAVTYCDFATGHENNANFGDANGRILLTLVPTENANEYTLTIKPNYANGATKKLDYLYVIAGGNSPYPAEAGTDEGGTSYDELSVTFTNSNATASFTIQWSNPDWGGRWQCTLTDVALSELTSCSGGGDPTPDPTPDPEPTVNPYCDFATGHENNANFGDANGRILLSIEPTENSNEYKLTLKPNYDNGATKKLDYMYVIAGGNSPYPAEAGVDEGGIGYDELSVTFTNSNATASFTIQWSNPDWGGRWQCTLSDVALSTLTSCSALAIASEYCGYQDPQTIKNGKNIALTWETNAGGDVVITMGNGTGTTSCSFRNGGFEGGIGAFIVSTDDFATSEAASNYFTATQVYSGNTYTLTKIADLPANAKIKHVGSGHALAWTLDGASEYCYPDFIYTYGGVCAEVPELTSIVVAASPTIAQIGDEVTITATPLDQFGASIEATVEYEFSPADAGTMNGNVFTFTKTCVATITAKSGDVQSSITICGVPSGNLALNKDCEGGYYDNNPGESYDKANDGNTSTQWVTYADQSTSKEWWYVDLGNVYSLAAISVVWGENYSTNYKLYARTEAPSDEQKADDTAWEEIATESGATANSEQFKIVNVNARYVRIHSLSRHGNCIRLKEVRVFGTEYVPVVDTEKPVMTSASLASSTYTEAIINVVATDNVGVYRYHIVDAGNSIDANLVADEGKITINNLIHATTYSFTITAKDAAGNESANSIAVAVTTPFDASINLALNKTCEGGYYDNNPAESADKANDGNNGTSWVTYGAHAAELDWWVVDLGQIYNLTNITALWANDAYATNYMLQARVEAPSAADRADDAAWVTLATVSGVTAGEEKSTNVSGVGRYVRFRATAHAGGFFRLREFRVYASGVATVDTEKPEMTSASLVSYTDSRAIIAVAATDNQGIANYHVVDADNSFDANFVAEAGNITVTGLTGGTNYTFDITAIDYFGNESANSKSVAVSTVAHLTAPQAACPAPTWDADLVKAMYSPTYDADYTHQDWGSGTVATKDEFGRKYVTNNNGFFGADGFALNCLMMEKLHYDIWIADDATVRFVPIWGGDEQGITKNLVGQQWNSIDIDLTEYTGITNWGNIYQMKIDQAPNLTFWVANAYFYRETAIVDSEAPTNVSASLAATGFYSVKISAQAEDNSGAVIFKVMNGEEVLATGAAASGVATTIAVNGLASGRAYNLNVVAYDDANNAAAPVAVAATTKVVPAPAPAPVTSGKIIVPVFTDAIAGGKTNISSGGWGETTQVEWLDVAPGDKVFYGQNFNYAGWHSWGADIDATHMMFLHVDIYSTGMTQVSVTPISPGHEGVANITLTPNAWTSADVPLSAYVANGIEWNKIFQFKFMNPVGGNELMIDNVYFWQPEVKTTTDADGNGWASFASAEKVAVPSGLTAYWAEYSKNEVEETLVLHEITERVIPAGAGVLLRGTANTSFNFEVTTAEAPDLTGNNLVGCTVRTDVSEYTETHDIFCLRRSDLFDQTAFFLYTGQYIPAGKAYLKLPKQTNAPAGAARRVRFVFDTATSLEPVEMYEVTKFIENGQMFIRRGDAVYTIQGTRVK